MSRFVIVSKCLQHLRVLLYSPHTAITTVGYGDLTPRSFLGRLITIPLLVFGLLLIALPTFVLGREFSLVWEMMKENQVRPALQISPPRPHAPPANIPRGSLQRAVRRPARIALAHARALFVFRLAPHAGRATAGRGLAAGGSGAPRPDCGSQGDCGGAGRASAAARQRDGGWGAGTESRERKNTG